MKLKPLHGQAQPAPGPVSAGHVRKHILYVEDEDNNWLIAEPNLRDRYHLKRARDAKSAFEAVQAQEFDCVLMDIQLAESELDGIQITQILRGTYPGVLPPYAHTLPDWTRQVPIIFVTAYTARYDRAELVGLGGGSELIGKPVNFVTLALTMSRLISGSILKSDSKAPASKIADAALKGRGDKS